MKEYLSAKQEVLLHVQLYKTQERNGAILIGLLGLLIPLLVGQSISIPAIGIQLPSTHWTDLVILFTISTVTFYMFFAGLAILFALQLLALFYLFTEKPNAAMVKWVSAVLILHTVIGAHVPLKIWAKFANSAWYLVDQIMDAPAAGTILGTVLTLCAASMWALR